MKPARRRPLTTHDALALLVPIVIGVVWAFIAVDLTFLLEIDWQATPHSLVAAIAYALQFVLFWPSAIFTLAARGMPLIGWQPGWVGLSFLVAVCGGVPGAVVGLVVFSWSRR